MPESFYAQKQSELSPFVDHYWHMVENHKGYYPLYATVKWGFVFSSLNGSYRVRLIGPRTTPVKMSFQEEEYFWGIVMNAEVNLAGYSKRTLLNNIIDMPVSQGTFMLANETVQLPTYDKLDDFIKELIDQSILYSTSITTASYRDKQRKTKQSTGLTLKQIEQADRVERAITIMEQSASLSEVAADAGFSDQAHMTRDFQRFVGCTPAEIRTMFKK